MAGFTPKEQDAYMAGFRSGVRTALSEIDEHEHDRAKRWAKLRETLKHTPGAMPKTRPAKAKEIAK